VIDWDNFSCDAFDHDLHEKYFETGPGIYIAEDLGDEGVIWEYKGNL